MRKSNEWTMEEMELVRDLYPSHTAATLVKMMGRHTEKSVRHLAIELGVSKHPDWSEKEIEILRNHYGRSSLTWLAGRLRRTEKAVRWKAYSLGLQQLKTWREEDDRLVRSEYPSADLFKLACKLGVSVNALRHRARKLGVRRSQ